ncbi:uncharacterized protein LOC105283780 isoform X1 [Ooceraea biroi]|uniref:uncharacterized protein LOC105283780 isoform X1 n=1 Tax=Ooceraea biroi TaxID=2015173 RepID=UPI000F0969B6|nr:uncharacterized protein LOC105283780 isoform X1 [Ooceraea biroi]
MEDYSDNSLLLDTSDDNRKEHTDKSLATRRNKGNDDSVASSRTLTVDGSIGGDGVGMVSCAPRFQVTSDSRRRQAYHCLSHSLACSLAREDRNDELALLAMRGTNLNTNVICNSSLHCYIYIYICIYKSYLLFVHNYIRGIYLQYENNIL